MRSSFDTRRRMLSSRRRDGGTLWNEISSGVCMAPSGDLRLTPRETMRDCVEFRLPVGGPGGDARSDHGRSARVVIPFAFVFQEFEQILLGRRDAEHLLE